MEILTSQNDAEPAWLLSGELTASLDHPSTVVVKLHPKLIFSLPRAFSQMTSEVYPSHECSLGLENGDVGGLQGISESASCNCQSLSSGLHVIFKPLLVLKDLL